MKKAKSREVSLEKESCLFCTILRLPSTLKVTFREIKETKGKLERQPFSESHLSIAIKILNISLIILNMLAVSR